jgi:hypothetical protein
MIATGAILDRMPPLSSSISLGIQTRPAGREAVRKQAEAGVNRVKVYSGLKKEVFPAVADEAQKYGLKTVGHVPEEIYMEEAVAAGLRSSEHLFGVEKVIAKWLGEKVNRAYAGQGSEVAYFSRLNELDTSPTMQATWESQWFSQDDLPDFIWEN